MQANQKLSKTLIITFLTLSVIALADIAWADEGPTTKAGCHTNRKTNDTHCHYPHSGSGLSPMPLPKKAGDFGFCSTYQDCMTHGMKAQRKGDTELALIYYKQALILQPNDLAAFTTLSILEPYVIDISGSCTSYNNCMKLGYAAMNQKQYQTALVNFKRALGYGLANNTAFEATSAIRTVCQYIHNSRR
ncbi:hypothetical protein [Microcoleus sp. F4-D5]|uniref:hypothetical protein n=1 Tax=Microcoleus sp. F4-D5 TaxID=2818760 RepID=UPI002FCF96B3